MLIILYKRINRIKNKKKLKLIINSRHKIILKKF